MNLSRERDHVPRPWTRWNHWLRSVPLQDPADRRNALMLQGLLIVIGLLIPVLAILRWLRDWKLLSVNVMIELITLALFLMVCSCLYLIRIGRFRVSVHILVASSLLLMGVSYAVYGLRAQTSVALLHTFPLMLGGLLLGRAALWRIYGVLMLVLVLGAMKDLSHSLNLLALRADAWTNLLRAALGFSLIAVILDRSVGAWRSTLATATRRGEELTRARDRLEHEMIERERSHAQLAHAQKMKAVGLLAGGIAHDFNNLLGVILGYAGRPAAGSSLEVANESLAGIRDAAKRGALITQRLLSFSRDDVAQSSVFDAMEALREVLPMLQQLFDANVRVEMELAHPAPLHIRLDPAEFQLALLNIAANARDAMPDGGVFQISARLRPSPSDTHGGCVLISLRDTGCGMSTAQVTRAIEPFYTSKPFGQGTGLGLSVVHRLITEAGGQLDIESSPGTGTTIHFILPCVRTGGSTGTVAASAITDLQVLLIEDDDLLRPLLTDALRAVGAQVSPARDGRSAEALARKLQRVDVVISDFDLGHTLADALIERLLPLLPRARFLLISGQADAGARSRLKNLAVDFLQKPFTPDELVGKLQRMLAPRGAL